jgi:hypothetical protein
MLRKGFCRNSNENPKTNNEKQYTFHPSNVQISLLNPQKKKELAIGNK